jgi:hypothetical protein
MELSDVLADTSYSFSQEISIWNTPIAICTTGLNMDERHRNFPTSYFGNVNQLAFEDTEFAFFIGS